MKIYRKASEHIANNLVRYACDAILWADINQDTSEFRAEFSKWFNPFSNSGLWWGPVNRENQLARSLGLLFMQEIHDEARL